MSLQNIFDKLGLNDKNGLHFLKDNNWQNLFNYRTVQNLKKLQPTAFFSLKVSLNDSEKPFILFFDNPSNQKRSEIFKNCWNFNESPVIIINLSNQIHIYNGFNFIKETGELEELSENAVNDFEYYKLVTGETWQKYENNLQAKNRVDYKLLNNIDNTIEKLINDKELSREVANNLIGRIIFIRYLIDRKVRIKFNSVLKEFTKEDLYENLKNINNIYNLFNYLQRQFNGNLFPITNEEKKQVKQDSLNLILSLLKGDEIAKGQMSLFDVYDFSIIPVEFISNVY